MRVAIVHYWLVGMRGGERVLERLLRLFPQADIFTHVFAPEAISDEIKAHSIQTTFIQRLPGAQRHYQKYLPLMPMALEELDLRGYDLVISSESGPAKGVITSPDTVHVCYCHSPMRYLWDHYPDYREAAGLVGKLAIPWLYHKLRIWDVASAARVDQFVANSNFIRRRIEKVYRRDATVVYPPVDLELFQPSEQVEPFYLWVGQMTPYKRADVAVDAFNTLGLPLVMVGDGLMADRLRRKAKSNITILQRVRFDELRRLYAQCRGLIFTPEEDFGIVPVEAMASGRPVLAFGRGGALDTVVPEKTGLYFDSQTPESLIEGVRRFEMWLPNFDPGAARAQALRFAPDEFDKGFLKVIAKTGLPLN